MSEPLFAVDEMLGSLARWLRIMGYDSTYQRDRKDREILETARAEGRLLLTRDRQLAERAGDGGLYVESDDLWCQLRQVSRAYSLRFEGRMTRCTKCNGELVEVGREEVKDKVPQRVLENNERLYRCPSCGQVYWKGTHWDNISKRLNDLEGQSL